jgi:hypothetical protein
MPRMAGRGRRKCLWLNNLQQKKQKIENRSRTGVDRADNGSILRASHDKNTNG